MSDDQYPEDVIRFIMNTKPPPWVRQWQVPSSKAGKTYIVSLSRFGDWACSCVGWTSHTPRKACKHIKLAKETGDMYLLWVEDAVNRRSASPPPKSPDRAVAISGKKRAITFDD